MVKFNKSINEYDYVLSFDLAKHNCAKTAYGLAIIFGVLIIFILMQYKKDKLNAVRNANKKNIRRQNNNHRRNYTQRKSN